jgi:Holliday junction resolvasome RuvABC endonuclease subunit
LGATLFLGVDQSLNGTGICLLDATGTPVRLETVRPGKRRDVERLAHVKSRLLHTLKSSIKFGCFEGYAYHSTGRVFELGEIGGVLKLTVFEHRIPYLVVSPASLKKFATRNSGAKKAAMVKQAVAEGADVADDNQADAFFLAMIARHIHTGITPATRARMDVVHLLLHPPVKKRKPRPRKLVKHPL